MTVAARINFGGHVAVVALVDDAGNAIGAGNPLAVNASITATATTTARATAAAPTYVEGDDSPISQTLDGKLRVAASVSATVSQHSTASAPSYSEGDDSPFSGNLTGDLRTIAKQGTAIWNVKLDQSNAGVTNVISASNFPAAVDVNAGAAGANTPRVVIATGGATPLPTGASTSANQTTANTSLSGINTDTTTLNTVLGTKADAKNSATDTTAITAMSVWKQISASIQAAAASLAGTLTVATHAVTQSGSWVIAAGSAIIGKVSIDQTTPGTTDSVSVATAQGAGAAIGAISGAAVITDANGTIQQYLRGLVKQWIAGTLVLGTGANAIGSITNSAFPAIARASKGKQNTTITSSTAETTIVTAGGSSVKLDLYGLVLTNISATASEVVIRDDTGGTILGSIMVPAGDTRGFMLGADSAIPQAVANKPWTAQCGTSVASMKITALYTIN